MENTNRHELKNMKERNILYKELSYKIVGTFYEFYNTLGPGYKEIVYHKTLAIEFGLRGLKFEEKKKLEISYKGHKVGIYEPDFVIENKIIVEIKAVPEILKVYEKQLYYYLIGTNYQLGYLVNFGAEKLDIRRRIYT